MARARGVRTELYGAFEDTERTAPANGFVNLGNLSHNLGEERGLIEDDRVGTRDPGDSDQDNPTVDGDVRITMDPETIGWWLKGLLGAPTTTETAGTYTHVFESNAWSLPSMSLEAAFADVPSYEMFSGLRANSLSYTMSRGGRLDGTVSVIGQAKAAPTTSSGAGTPSDFSIRRFMQKQGVVEIDGAPRANVMECSVTYTNNLDPVQSLTTDGYIGGLDPMRAALSGTLRLRFDSEALFDTARAETPVALQLLHTISADASLTLAMPRVWLSLPKHPVEGPQGVEAAFDWIAAKQTNGDPMLTATVVNEVAGY